MFKWFDMSELNQVLTIVMEDLKPHYSVDVLLQTEMLDQETLMQAILEGKDKISQM